MKESLVALRELLISYQKLSEPVEPGVRRLHNPTSVLGWTPSSAFLSRDSWGVAMDRYLFASRFTVISLIRIQEPLSSFGKGHDDSFKHCRELTDVMSVGPGDDQGQRDATAVHQKVSFASLFFPDLSGSDRLLPVRGAL